jgi:hypothetical protein
MYFSMLGQRPTLPGGRNSRSEAALAGNSVAFSPQANYTDWATETFRRYLAPTFVDRGVARGQRGGSPTVVNLSFLDRSVPSSSVNLPRSGLEISV